VRRLKDIANRFDATSIEARNAYLLDLTQTNLVQGKDLIVYYETLLFLLSYPVNKSQLDTAEKEMTRITKFLKNSKNTPSKFFENSGLPFIHTFTRFSHDCVRWLLSHPQCLVKLDSFGEPSLQLNDVLRLTLTSLEKSETTAGCSNEELMHQLLVSTDKQLSFIINELARFDQQPSIKDHLFDSLDLFVRVVPIEKHFSKAYNRQPVKQVFYTGELLKKFDTGEWLNRPLPETIALSKTERDQMVLVIKNSMVITARETDPTTYMDESSLDLYQLERGVSIATYAMVPARQLPIESYIGYTAFKNGFPVAYGGSWVFGDRSNFGINIFESFRSGESGFVMIQLLRVFGQVFRIRSFEVEPYQFGLDNPEGIASGAFWFYYRFGFRPVDKQLRELAGKENEKIKSQKNYRSTSATLTRFTKSNLRLQSAKPLTPRVSSITTKVTRMIARKFHGDRQLAEEMASVNFLNKTNQHFNNHDENQVLTEVALWAEAFQIEDTRKLSMMVDMIKTKPNNAVAYQQLIRNFFSS
jgi:hypothetical protein